ncbi:MAG: hypothetical protein M1268_02340 [Patescibacteria group bacterium]|nr:hypothetical protein [Patescibacteria group bacterium]
MNVFKKNFINLLPFVIVFISSLYVPTDADLGWHLKYGEHFFKTGKILRDNIFSTQMANYKWVNHSWGTDLISYSIFNNFGFLGLTILGALIVTLTFYFFSKAYKLSLWNKTLIFPLMLYFVNPVNLISFRSQLISILFTGILFFVLSKQDENKKYLYFLPLIFLTWANLHGGFIIGFAIYALWVFIKVAIGIILKNKDFKREIFFLLSILILSIIACLINPFGIGVFKESFNHFGNPALKYIMEWTSFEDFSDLWWNQIIIINLILIGTIFMFFSGKIRQNLPFIIIAIILFLMSFTERRYAWTAYYSIIVFIKPVADFFKPDSKKYTNLASTIILGITLIIVIFIKSPFDQYSTMSWDRYCKDYIGCSSKSAEFLQNYKYDKEKLLTLYNWGGWLIWNYPEIKPTVDGRMTLWKGENGYSGFLDYYSYEQNWKDINKSKYNIVYVSPYKSIYNRLIQLTKEKKWKLVYKDKYSGIFVRNSVTD